MKGTAPVHVEKKTPELDCNVDSLRAQASSLRSQQTRRMFSIRVSHNSIVCQYRTSARQSVYFDISSVGSSLSRRGYQRSGPGAPGAPGGRRISTSGFPSFIDPPLGETDPRNDPLLTTTSHTLARHICLHWCGTLGIRDDHPASPVQALGASRTGHPQSSGHSSEWDALSTDVPELWLLEIEGGACETRYCDVASGRLVSL